MKKYIFVLICPVTDKIKFVGHSNNPIRRYNHYCYDYHKQNAIAEWVRSFPGKRPEMKVIETVTSKKQIKDRVAYWKDFYKENDLLRIEKVKKTIMVRFLVTPEDFALINTEAEKHCNGKISEYVRGKVLNKKA